MFELSDIDHNASIKVLGIGGAGCHMLRYLEQRNFSDAELIFIDTNNDHELLTPPRKSLLVDVSKLNEVDSSQPINIGLDQDQKNELEKIIDDSDLIILVAGMGGYSGTELIVSIAQLAKSKKIFTIACVTSPFLFEGRKRSQNAKVGLSLLGKNVESLFVIQSEFYLGERGQISLLDAFERLNSVSYDFLTTVTSLIYHPGMINIDMVDIKSVLGRARRIWLGRGIGQGEERAHYAAVEAIQDLRKFNFNFDQASGILVNITAGESLMLGEFSEVGDVVEDAFPGDCTVIVGTVVDPSIEPDIQVSIIVVGDELNEVKSKNMGGSPSHTYTIDRTIQHFSLGERTAKRVHDLPLDYREIPSFRRRLEADDYSPRKASSSAASSGLKVIAAHNTTDEEIAELILHLSNVYKSVGGDELVISSVKNIPPSDSGSYKSHMPHKKGNAK